MESSSLSLSSATDSAEAQCDQCSASGVGTVSVPGLQLGFLCASFEAVHDRSEVALGPT